VLAVQVFKQAAARVDHLQQAAAAVVVLLVGLEVLGEVHDACGQQGDLDFGGTGVVLAALVVFNDGTGIDGHRLCLSVMRGPQERPHADRHGRTPREPPLAVGCLAPVIGRRKCLEKAAELYRERPPADKARPQSLPAAAAGAGCAQAHVNMRRGFRPPSPSVVPSPSTRAPGPNTATSPAPANTPSTPCPCARRAAPAASTSTRGQASMPASTGNRQASRLRSPRSASASSSANVHSLGFLNGSTHSLR